MSPESRLARHLAQATFDALPDEALAAGKRSLVDTLAVAWGARGAPGVAEVTQAALQGQDGGSSTLWPSGSRAPARSAAFANSVAAAALDFDSVHPAAAIHPDLVAVPVALAVGETCASGRDALTAIVLADDLLCRFALATRANSGWFYTSVYGAIAGGAITARLLGSSERAIAHAMGLGFLNASGTYQPIAERSLSKRALAAFAADAGVLCGYLASAGLTGPHAWLEGAYGLQALYERGDLASVTADLGRAYRNAEIGVKPYPSCQANHAPLDALLALCREERVRAEDVDHIEVVLTPYMHRLVGAPYEPGTNPQVAAQFSVQYSLASALVRGRLGIAEIRERAALDPTVTAWAQRVRVTVDATSTGNYAPATVRVRLGNGRTLSRTASVLRGGAQAPLGREGLLQKLATCLEAGGYDARPGHVEEVFDAIMRIDEAPRVAEWMARLSKLVGAA